MFSLKFLADGTSCRNSQIQRGACKVCGLLRVHVSYAHAWQELEVKKSTWGLGAFLAEPAKAGDLVAGMSFSVPRSLIVTPFVDRVYRGTDL